MSVPRCTDAEFIRIWRELNGNGRDVAAALKADERNTYKRRRRIELRHKIRLEPGMERADIAAKYEALMPRQHKARIHTEVNDGVVIVFSDAHFWPGIRTTTFRALLKFCRELKPKAIICNGDAFDGASISRHPPIGWEHLPTVKDEIKTCKDRLGEIEEVTEGIKRCWTLGNHDFRFETRLATVAPEYAGIKGFHLKDEFPGWAPCWTVQINQDVMVKHRMRGGMHATQNNTLWAGRTMITGHLHNPKVAPVTDYNGTRWGVDTGTLAEPEGPQFVDYTEDNPKNWRSAFVVLTFQSGRLLTPELVHKHDETSVDFRGHVIQI